MYLIAGLGNPTREYNRTRHNVGFEAIDILADLAGLTVTERKHRALCARGMVKGHKVILAKPQTFMNLSGDSIREITDYYQIEPGHVIILCDDINLPEGQLRIRIKGSAGGHNGLKSIINQLGTQEFPRIRIGVGEKPLGMDLADYVLGRFPRAQRELMEQAYEDAARAVVMVLESGTDAAMNHYNRKNRGDS